MSEICKNCKYEIALNFCSNCGQKKSKRIDAKYIKDELQYTLVHTNKGFFFSIKKILREPGTTARLFLEGDRVNHYKPIALVFILAGIGAFISNMVIDPIEIMRKYYAQNHINMLYDTTEFSHTVMKYYALMMLATVPFMAFFSWISFKKWGYNYYENVIINAYFLALFLIVNIVVFIPLQYVLSGNPELFMFLPAILSLFAVLGMAFWFFPGLYPQKSVGTVIIRVILMFALEFIAFMIVSVIAGILMVVYFKSRGLHPEDLMQVNQKASSALFTLKSFCRP